MKHTAQLQHKLRGDGALDTCLLVLCQQVSAMDGIPWRLQTVRSRLRALQCNFAGMRECAANLQSELYSSEPWHALQPSKYE